VNILRNAVSAFSAQIAGVEAFTSVAFDRFARQPDLTSRRIARNTVHVLQDEAHLHRVVDPAGGSWFLDSLTQELAETAWQTFQQIESEGGMLAALEKGWVAEQIDHTHQARSRDIALRKAGVTGVSEFPNLSEEPLRRSRIDTQRIVSEAIQRCKKLRKSSEKPIDSLSSVDRINFARQTAEAGATIGQIAAQLGFHESSHKSSALPHHRIAAPFEQLRDASDVYLAEHGSRPTAFLVNLGPVAHHVARANFASNFFQAGGVEVISNDGFGDDLSAAADAYQESGASIAVICSSDKLYEQFVPQIAALLKKEGAPCVVLAGHPGEHEAEWKSQGVNHFIFMKCDVLSVLSEILQEQGVLSS
jgi:methylmalonyl-CoA mutase